MRKLYTVRLLWLKATRPADTDTGEQSVTLTANGYLWCSVEETNGRQQDHTGTPRTGADAEIRVRNYPEISTDDVLLDETFEQYWRVDSLYQGANEMILDCFRLDGETAGDFTIES